MVFARTLAVQTPLLAVGRPGGSFDLSPTREFVSLNDRQSDAAKLVHDGRPADSRSADHERDDFDGVVAGDVREEGDIGHDDA